MRRRNDRGAWIRLAVVLAIILAFALLVWYPSLSALDASPGDDAAHIRSTPDLGPDEQDDGQ